MQTHLRTRFRPTCEFGLKMAGCENTWRDSEVNALLEVSSNDAIQRQLSGSYRNKVMCRKIRADVVAEPLSGVLFQNYWYIYA